MNANVDLRFSPAIRDAGQVIAERRKGGVRWQARISSDRGRLEVVGIVPPSATPVTIEPLTDRELRELLEGDGHR